MKREKTLDCLRGWAILQVVFVHVMYWLYSIKPTVPKSFLLFEMLLFFFVTGAANSLKEHRSYGEFCLKRIKGLMIPYYIYAAICVAIAFMYQPDPGSLTPGAVCQTILSWLVPINTQIGPVDARGRPLWFYTWALWFVPIYLIAIVLFPPVKKLVRRYGRASIAFLTLGFLLVDAACCLLLKKAPDGDGVSYGRRLAEIIQESAFYTIFMGVGVLYGELKKRGWRDLAVSLSVLVSSVAGLCVSHLVFGQTLDMQENKFPPNHVFLLYAFAFMALLYLAFPLLKKLYRLLAKAVPPVDGWVAVFSENSMTVFLYQPFAFWLTYLVLRNFGLRKTAWEPYVAVLVVYHLAWLMVKYKALVQSVFRSHSRR